MGSRRDELADAATDYALEHGLIGLSLRPLAAALGTSDRMLLYHFDSKDDLVASLVRNSTQRAVERVRALPRSAGVADAVLRLWRTVSGPEVERLQCLYVEAAAVGLFGTEPYAAVVRESNAMWTAVLEAHLRDAGLTAPQAARAVVLLDAVFMGLLLDLPLHPGREAADRAVAELAAAVARQISDG
jgi:AcrR family transcriptional regulator